MGNIRAKEAGWVKRFHQTLPLDVIVLTRRKENKYDIIKTDSEFSELLHVSKILPHIIDGFFLFLSTVMPQGIQLWPPTAQQHNICQQSDPRQQTVL